MYLLRRCSLYNPVCRLKVSLVLVASFLGCYAKAIQVLVDLVVFTRTKLNHLGTRQCMLVGPPQSGHRVKLGF